MEAAKKEVKPELEQEEPGIVSVKDEPVAEEEVRDNEVADDNPTLKEAANDVLTAIKEEFEVTDSTVKEEIGVEVKEEPVSIVKEETSNNAETKCVPEVAASASEVLVFEEETRMSAENSSRGQTPAKQVPKKLLSTLGVLKICL